MRDGRPSYHRHRQLRRPSRWRRSLPEPRLDHAGAVASPPSSAAIPCFTVYFAICIATSISQSVFPLPNMKFACEYLDSSDEPMEKIG
nr:hypothetical protein Itr_chr01CG13380 [Ipomoea trifida]